MHLLQPEVQLDIFKYLNFKQLLNIQQTNRFYKNFINEYEEKLARKKSHGLTADCISCLDYYNLYTPEPKLYDFQISEELEKKWKCGIEESIPMFLYQDNININIIAFEIKESTDLEPVDCYAEIYLEFPNFPKNIDEMKIARYLLQQIFNSTFEYVNFSDFIFNPQIIELLFDEGKTKIPLQIHSKRARLYIRNKIDEYFYKFILNYLVVSHELILTLKRHTKKEHINNLFKFLTNGGNRFSYVYCEFHDLKLINLFIQYIETSKNISKMVKKISFERVRGDLLISERAENIERNEDIHYKYIKYQLSNKYNPKTMFSIYSIRSMFGLEATIKRID